MSCSREHPGFFPTECTFAQNILNILNPQKHFVNPRKHIQLRTLYFIKQTRKNIVNCPKHLLNFSRCKACFMPNIHIQDSHLLITVALLPGHLLCSVHLSNWVLSDLFTS